MLQPFGELNDELSFEWKNSFRMKFDVCNAEKIEQKKYYAEK